jgi:hypothetical protein
VTWFVVFVAAAMTLLCSQADAQTRHNLLRGLSGLDLVIEALSSRVKSCGLTEEAIRAAAIETPRVHHAARRRSRMAARGARAAGGQTADHWIPGRDYAAAGPEGLPATRLRTGERLHLVP